MMLRRVLIVSCITLLAGLSVAYSRPSVDVVYQTAQPKLMRSTVAVVDSAAVDGGNDIILPSIHTSGKQTLRVSARFSVSGATCVITCVRGSIDPTTGVFSPADISHTTATAATRYTIGGLYVADTIVFDTGGYTDCIIIVDAPSSGTITIWSGVI